MEHRKTYLNRRSFFDAEGANLDGILALVERTGRRVSSSIKIIDGQSISNTDLFFSFLCPDSENEEEYAEMKHRIDTLIEYAMLLRKAMIEAKTDAQKVKFTGFV
jgi:hypothetical protein